MTAFKLYEAVRGIWKASMNSIKKQKNLPHNKQFYFYSLHLC